MALPTAVITTNYMTGVSLYNDITSSLNSNATYFSCSGNESVAGDYPILRLRWSRTGIYPTFAIGTTGTPFNNTITYPGTFTVYLCAEDTSFNLSPMVTVELTAYPSVSATPPVPGILITTISATPLTGIAQYNHPGALSNEATLFTYQFLSAGTASGISKFCYLLNGVYYPTQTCMISTDSGFYNAFHNESSYQNFYSYPGEYTAYLSGFDVDGNLVTDSIKITAVSGIETTVTGPTANFSLPSSSYYPGVSYTFIDTSLSGTYPITSRLWNFIGASYTSISATHIFNSEGEQPITLTVSALGAEHISSIIKHIDVSSKKPTASFTASVPFYNPFANVSALPQAMFTDTSVSPDALLFPITSWNWDFSDGTTSTDQNPTHYFPRIGTYRVGLSANNGEIGTYYQDVTINDVDIIYFSQIPEYSNPGCRSAIPYEVTLLTTTTGEHYINLYAQYSRSAPYLNLETKYQHLLPQWRFLNTDGDVIEGINTEDTSYYNICGEFLGIRGTAQFYYIDDMPTLVNNPVSIFATAETSGYSVSYDDEKSTLPGYSNSKVIAVAPHYIKNLKPTKLKITRNGLNDFYPLKWANVKFPYVVTPVNDSNSECGCSDVTLFDYPSSNALGSQYPVNLTFNFVPSASAVWNTNPGYFQRIDGNDYYVGGFVKGDVYSTVSALNVTISAETVMQYESEYQYSPYAWISNSNNVALYRMQCLDVPNNLSASEIQPLTAYAKSVQIPYSTSSSDVMAITGQGGIFGIAMDPCFNIWCADSELDRLLKLDATGTLITSIDLKTLTNEEVLTPAGVAIDRDLNVWTTLWDSVSVLKFDSEGNFLFATAPTGVDISQALYVDAIVKTPQVDTDSENNIWTSCASETCSMLVKYDSAGNNINTISIPGQTPIDLIVDNDDSLWVANAYGHYLSGSITKYDSAGTLIQTWPLTAGYPGYVTLDTTGKLWFTYGFDKVGVIETGNATISSISVSGDRLTVDDLWFDENNRIDIQLHEGIACDAKNRIWVINSVENKMYIINASDLTQYNIFPIYPNNTTEYYNDLISYIGQYSETVPWTKSAQAFGDWTGYRWIRKYETLTTPGSTIIQTVTGISNEFDIKSLVNDNDIRRFNESWAAQTQMRSYALPEHINDKYNFFENFLGSAIGGVESERQQIGRVMYEKIGNFVNNQADIDVCNINQLYSLAQAVDTPIDDYKLQYPFEIARLMDIASINHQKLWGARCKCNKNFSPQKGKCIRCNHEHDLNRSLYKFNPYSYMVSAGTPFVTQSKFGNAFRIVETINLGGSSVYPLTAVSTIDWLGSADRLSYNYYEYIPTFCNEQVDGVINWDDNYTTLLETNSSLSAWYGDFGIVEEMFNYMLHKGLDMEI